MTTYDIKVWALEEQKGKRRSTWRVRWLVAGERFSRTFQTKLLGENFRSRLVIAQREGVAFDEKSGLPEPMARELRAQPWYAHAIAYVDMTWPKSSARHRKGIAETLAAVTPLLVKSDRGMPPAKVLRAALYGWSFNRSRRLAGAPPAEFATAVDWISRNTVDIGALADAATVRRILDAVAVLLDGSPAAAATVNRKRAVLSGALRYAVELRHLDNHPFTYVNWSAPRADEQVDRRVVVNPGQARALLAAIREAAPELEAFFGCMYFAALRPEEVLNLSDDEYERPTRKGGWGWLHLSGATLTSGNGWTDDGDSVERRGLKHRSKKAVRDVPVSPELAALLDRHIAAYDPGQAGRLFVTRRGAGGVLVAPRGRPIPNNSYAKAWRDARAKTLTPAQQRSPLARRPYDLRHAAVSLWLNSGVPAPQVAEWAGHSVNVLMRVYAKCVDGQAGAARRRIEEALGEPDLPGDDEPTEP